MREYSERQRGLVPFTMMKRSDPMSIRTACQRESLPIMARTTPMILTPMEKEQFCRMICLALLQAIRVAGNLPKESLMSTMSAAAAAIADPLMPIATPMVAAARAAASLIPSPIISVCVCGTLPIAFSGEE